MYFALKVKVNFAAQFVWKIPVLCLIIFPRLCFLPLLLLPNIIFFSSPGLHTFLLFFLLICFFFLVAAIITRSSWLFLKAQSVNQTNPAAPSETKTAGRVLILSV